MRFKYSQEHLLFLCLGYKEIRTRELIKEFNEEFRSNQTETAIRSVLRLHRFRCGRKPGFITGERLIAFTFEQSDFIKDKYKQLSLKDLAEEFNLHFSTNKSVDQIRCFTRNHSIKSGRTGCFEKGQTSWNKGVTGYMGPNKTSFKKGSIPPNRLPVGTERITRDGYVEVKINEPNPYVPGQMTRWKLKHLYLWIKENGPLPEGHMLTFLDGDKENCEPENLMLISRAVNAYLNRNGYGDLAGELKLSAIAIAKVAQKASQLKKEAAEV